MQLEKKSSQIYNLILSFTNSLHVFLQLSVCKELQLPSSEYNYTADLVAVTSNAPLETAAVQSISVLAVAAEGTARLWPSLAQEGNYTETDVDLGDLCNFVVAVRVSTSSINLKCTLTWQQTGYQTLSNAVAATSRFLFVIHHRKTFSESGLNLQL